MSRFNPLKLIKPMSQDPAQASLPAVVLLIPGLVVLLLVAALNLVSWLRSLLHP